MSETRVVVDGLRELNKALKSASDDAALEMKRAMHDIAESVIADVRPRVPHRTGKSAQSYKARSGVKGASVAFGGSRTPHVPWLEFGGRVGRGKSVSRTVIRGGRYLYPAIADNMEDVAERVADVVNDITANYGFQVEGS